MYRLDMNHEQYDVLTRIVSNIIEGIVTEEGEFTPSDIEVVISMGMILNKPKHLPDLRSV
jgi:hypothetical protein